MLFSNFSPVYYFPHLAYYTRPCSLAKLYRGKPLLYINNDLWCICARYLKHKYMLLFGNRKFILQNMSVMIIGVLDAGH